MSRTVDGKQQLESLVAASNDRLVVLDFTAVWCGPCKMIGPVFEAIAASSGDRAVFCKVDGDRNRELVTLYGVTGFPTFVFLRRGVELDRCVGADEGKLRSLVDRHITPPPPPEPTSQWASFPVSLAVSRDGANPKAARDFLVKNVTSLDADEIAKISAIAEQLAINKLDTSQPGIMLKPFVKLFSLADEKEKHFAAVDLIRMILSSEAGANAVALMESTPLAVLSAHVWQFALKQEESAGASKSMANRYALAWECVANALCYEKTRNLVLPVLLSHLNNNNALPSTERAKNARAHVLFNLAAICWQTRNQALVTTVSDACVAAHRSGITSARLLGAIGTLYWTVYVESSKEASDWDPTSAMILASLDMANFPYPPILKDLKQLFNLPLQ